MKKHTLGKIEPKKILAHPKNEKSKAEYVTHHCVECDVEYLTQAILQHEMDFCPNHVDYLNWRNLNTLTNENQYY